MLEKQIETAVKDYARTMGCLAYKFVSPGHAFVPDCLIVTPTGRTAFIEFKRPGGKATPGQLREIERIRQHLVIAEVIDDIAVGKAFIDWLVGL